MKSALMFVVLSILLLPAQGLPCTPEETQVIVDETHSNRHSMLPGGNYEPLHDLLTGAGYPVTVWHPTTSGPDWLGLVGCTGCLPGGLDHPKIDADVLIEAMPQVGVNDPFILFWIAQWVSEGGVLVMITDHSSFPIFINALAARFDLKFRNINPVVGDGVSHCPPGVPSCLAGHISYLSTGMPALFAGGITHVTTYAGTTVIPLVPDLEYTPILTLGTGFSVQGSTFIPDGEDTLLLAPYGKGAVVAAAEAAMWTCGTGTGFLTGFCPEAPLQDGLFNDEFILNIMAHISLYRAAATIQDQLP